MFSKRIATALVVGSVAVAGCGGSHSGTVHLKAVPVTPVAPVVQDPGANTVRSHSPIGADGVWAYVWPCGTRVSFERNGQQWAGDESHPIANSHGLCIDDYVDVVVSGPKVAALTVEGDH